MGTLDGSRPSLLIHATSFAPNADKTRTLLMSWLHQSKAITPLKSGRYRVSLNGRLSRCSGLDAVIQVDPTKGTIVEIEGYIKTGTQCQSLRKYLGDESEEKDIPPIKNPKGM